MTYTRCNVHCNNRVSSPINRVRLCSHRASTFLRRRLAEKRHQGKSSMTHGIPRGRYPTINSDVARDRAISELRTGRRDGQLTRGPNWSALPLLITHKVIKSVTGLPHFSPNDSPHLAAQY